MSMSKKSRAGIVAGVAVAALALTGLATSAVANAADSTPSQGTSASQQPGGGHDGPSGTGQQRPVEEQLTGTTADKVTAAVEAKYPGATIDRLEKDADGGGVYEAHITKADGTHVTVLLDASFAVTGEDAHGPGGMDGHGAGTPDDHASSNSASPSGSAA